MQTEFSDRINDVPRSFIREILKVAVNENIISFAGGLPNPALFPVRQIRDAAVSVLDNHGAEVLQYSNSEGYLPLREWIADRYAGQGLQVDPDNILVTTGSQQGLDLLGKTLLNEGDNVAIEEPGYLGAIQAFSIYRPRFHGVPVAEGGVDTAIFESVIQSNKPKLFYCVPNFQNPSGISYDEDNRLSIAKILEGSSTYLIEDDPYGALRFSGQPKAPFKKLLPEQTILLGSFSKIVAPSFRLGWLVAEGDLMQKLLIAKQATDLHTPYINQRILYQYLSDNSIDDHIKLICENYGSQCQHMLQALQREFPDNCSFTRPEGGMFLWMTLPEGMSSMKLFEHAIKKQVAFVPGDPFYFDDRECNTLRLNFSCSNKDKIDEGIRHLGESVRDM
ncbi:MAG: 2-aminoadipate transaminase [Parasphingorhabdus sp.]|jgi:2-aminoadipate transaminase